MHFKNSLFLVYLLPLLICGQPQFPDKGFVFRDDVVPRADIFINPDSLAWIYNNVESYREFHADFVFTGNGEKDTVLNVGFRLRGNTSRFSAKKSFKVSFNTWEPGRKFHGLEKMNLNGEHNDPSVIRSKLCWDLLQDFKLPGARANHVEVYINDNYYGLYINVEHIDENFVKSRFGNKNGNLFKCLYPADLRYLGADPETYKYTSGDRRAYDLRTNTAGDDYSDIAHFIAVLNNTPDDQFVCEINKVFNVYDYLKIIAVDVFTGNWDGYIYNQNNFYLYHNTATGKFEYIPYDLDNTFGIDWFGVDWGNREIYSWQQDGQERPLYTKIMSNNELRAQYTFYLNQLISEFTNEDIYFSKIDQIRDMIYPYILDDPYYPLDYGFTPQDFLDSYNMALGMHVVYGIKPYIQARNSSALQQMSVNNIKPVVKYITNTPFLPDQNFYVTAFIEDEDLLPEVKLLYSINNGSQQTGFMYDDGEHEDGEAGDKIYGELITGIQLNMTLSYQVSSTDNFGYSTLLPCEPVTLQLIQPENPNLTINEFMAANMSTIADENGEYDDWIEVYNADTAAIWLGDKFLTDDLSVVDKWQMPAFMLQPGDFILFWADNDLNQGPNHTNFKLEKNGEQIGIYDAGSAAYAPIDTLTFGFQSADISYGRNPDGGPVWQFYDLPTPGAGNLTGAVNDRSYSSERLFVYPNPVVGDVIYFNRSVSFKLFDLTGKLVLIANDVEHINVDKLEKGIYLLYTNNGSSIKLIIQ